MRIGQGVRTGLGHGGITCVLQTQFSSFFFFFFSILAGGIKASSKTNIPGSKCPPPPPPEKKKTVLFATQLSICQNYDLTKIP